MQYLLGVTTLAGINLFAALGLTLLTGFTGMFSMGHAAFMALGGYSAALLVTLFGVPFPIALLLGGLAATLVSLVIGVPSLRNQMRGDYFAIVMMGFGTSVVLILNNIRPVIRGAMGLSGIPRLTGFWVVLIVDIIGIWLLRNFVTSQWGKNCVAIREQEVAAQMMGVDVYRTKLWALAISAFYCGVAGGMYGFFITYLQPVMFNQDKSSDILAAVVFGGMHSITGPAIASFFLVFVPELLREVAKWRLVVYGVVFVGIMTIRPQGLLGFYDISWESLRALRERLTGRGKGGSASVGR